MIYNIPQVQMLPIRHRKVLIIPVQGLMLAKLLPELSRTQRKITVRNAPCVHLSISICPEASFISESSFGASFAIESTPPCISKPTNVYLFVQTLVH